MNQPNQFHWLYTLFLFLLIGVFFSLFEKIDFQKTKYNKSDFIKTYRVDKKTFHKWVVHFGKDVFPDITEYDKLRKLNLLMVIQLTALFGSPEVLPVLSKKQIIEKGEGTYQSLRECIRANPEGFGITTDAYAALNIFPPLIAQKILDAYG